VNKKGIVQIITSSQQFIPSIHPSQSINNKMKCMAPPSPSSSQAENVARQVEASTSNMRSHHNNNDNNNNYNGTTTMTSSPEPTATFNSNNNNNNTTIDAPVPIISQDSALKRLGRRLRFRSRRALSAPPGLCSRRRLLQQGRGRQQQQQQQQGGGTRSSSSSPSNKNNNKRRKNKNIMLQEHYRLDQSDDKQPVVLPGLPSQSDNWARDLHDFFNLICLVPVVATNAMNWNWDLLLHHFHNFNNNYYIDNHHHHHHHHIHQQQQQQPAFYNTMADAWTGDYFNAFFYSTVAYFVTDLLWMVVAPHCVRSPMVIVQHHTATLLYICIPYQMPHVHWLMGACMCVEVNTWLLIARRVFNKQGFPPWTIVDMSFLSIRIKMISILFYVTWIAIRCLLYPYLMVPIWTLYQEHTKQVGTHWNLLLVCFPLHGIFCALNLKWTHDLLMSKVRYWRRIRSGGAGAGEEDNAKDKGL